MTIRDIRRDSGSDMLVGKMHSALSGREIDVILRGSGEDFIGYAEKCADYFNHMPDELLKLLKKYSLRYCEDMRDYFDPDAPEVPEDVSEETILDYVRVNSLIIRTPKDSSVAGFSVECSCDWEKEHGMEWTVRGGRVLYVGDFMCISPWYADSVYETHCRSYVYEDFYL